MSDVKQCKHGRNFCCECHMVKEVSTAREDELEALVLRFIEQRDQLQESIAQKDIAIESLLESNSDMTTCLSASEASEAALRAENSDALAVNRTLNAQIDALREELADITDQCTDHVNLYKAWTKERDVMQQRLTAAAQLNASLLDTARGLTIQMHAAIGNTELHDDCIRDLAELDKPTEPGEVE